MDWMDRWENESGGNDNTPPAKMYPRGKIY